MAKQLGSYPTFAGSGWSKGLLPIDTVDKLSKDRGVKVKIDQKTRLDWDGLRKKVKKGMRNATLMAIAPTANIGHVAGTTPGIDPQFAQIFSRSTLNGKFLEVNHNLVRDLKKLGLWDDLKMRFLQLKAIFKILTVFLRISRMFIKQASNSVRMRLLKWQPGLRSGLIKRFLEICIWRREILMNM